jgi:predicted O-methyltransferase YrrM
MIDYSEIIEISKNLDTQYEFSDPQLHTSIRMVNTQFPNSLTQQEAFLLYDTVSKNNLKAGYEVGSGFGISTLYLGTAFKENGGKLITMDAYLEEAFQDPYRTNDVQIVAETTKGYKSLSQLINHFELKNTVKQSVGYSPNDTLKNVEDFYGNEKKLDFVFIDALHTNEAVIADFESIKDKIDYDRFVIMIHDSDFTPEAISYIENALGIKSVMLTGPRPQGFCLSIISNIVEG